MLIEKARRLAHGYRNFNNYRLRMLLPASGTRSRRATWTTLKSEDPVFIRRLGQAVRSWNSVFWTAPFDHLILTTRSAGHPYALQAPGARGAGGPKRRQTSADGRVDLAPPAPSRSVLVRRDPARTS